MSMACTREDFLPLVINLEFEHLIYMTCKGYPIEICTVGLNVAISNVISKFKLMYIVL